MVDFIKRHRETLKPVSKEQEAEDILLARDGPRPEYPVLTVENQDYVLHSTKWVSQFEHLWSRLSTISLGGQEQPCLPNLVTSSEKDRLRAYVPNRIQDLSLHYHYTETIPGFSSWIVQQSPDLVRLQWYCAVDDGISPMEQLVHFMQGDASFGRKLEQIVLIRRIFRNATFQLLLESVVRLRCLNLCSSNFDRESWTILRTANPSHLKTLTELKLGGCRQLPAKAVHEMLCELPSLRIFEAAAVEDKEMVEDRRSWVCLDMEELALRLSLTSFSREPAVRTLAIQRYLAQVGRLTKLTLSQDFLPCDEEGQFFHLRVGDGFEALKNLRKLRSAIWARKCVDEDVIRWMLGNWPSLEVPSRSWLQYKLGPGSFQVIE